MSKKTIRVPENTARAIRAWCNCYSAKIDRINGGSKEDYTGYEQDLFEVFGCQVFGPTDPVELELETTPEFLDIQNSYETKGLIGAIKRHRELFRSDLITAKREVKEHAAEEGWRKPNY